jgi:NodT family efflux transporter outer membrane factor (OMF) lipoprotein
MKLFHDHIRPNAKGLSLGLVLLAFTGCVAVGPNYVPPETSLSPGWHSQLRGGLKAQEDPETLSQWWTTIQDPVLSGLIQRAAYGNLDLKKARSRIREARARRGIARSALFPTVDAAGSIVQSRSSDDSGTGQTNTLSFAGLDAAWELDIFGGVRRSIEAADANIGSAREGWHDVLVSLLAEVALNYIDLRTYQTRLTVAESNWVSQNETFQLTQWRYEAGLSDRLDVEQAHYNLENTQSQIPTLRTGAEQAMNLIAVLLGEQPGTVHKKLETPKAIPALPLQVAVGVPADLLRRRPDVRQAERDLAAQTAKIGVATAELYPKFTLKGSIGLEAFSFSSFFTAGSRTLSGGPGVAWRVFDAGAIRQTIEVQSALQEQSLITYETVVLNALKEVENAVVAYGEEQNRRQSLMEATRAAERALDLAQLKYQAGLSDFLNVLIAQRSLASFQDQLAQSDGTVVANLVRLYKALGGGWSCLAPSDRT